jgi:hypothetical protein
MEEEARQVLMGSLLLKMVNVVYPPADVSWVD